MPATEHGAIITAAARTVLRPMGCIQKGRSRTWLDDHGWWVTVIEFQPSSWSRGSYLNVGACWLWADKGFFSFDDGGRVDTFREFENVESFEPAAIELAERAKLEVTRLRERFPSIQAVATHLNEKEITRNDIWAHFNAGVSASLAGWPERARERLSMAASVAERDVDWENTLKRKCADLLDIVDNAQAFHDYFSECVMRERKALKLPSWNGTPLIS